MKTTPQLERLYETEHLLDRIVGHQLAIARKGLGLTPEDVELLTAIPAEHIRDHESGKLFVSIPRLYHLGPCLDLTATGVFNRLPRTSLASQG